ncbi:hypothetical protein GCM10010171_50410 [Actinokineospora fastidiosa]|uniref:Uncharacterized protein n=1 Tax=Actinokineospora fastidiosa TaxID=1816 RepID=A0A918GPE3_9PSEU|nr:hypothetical protein GCM10010171_50410 [Actinokineospora fastidiosa]
MTLGRRTRLPTSTPTPAALTPDNHSAPTDAPALRCTLPTGGGDRGWESGGWPTGVDSEEAWTAPASAGARGREQSAERRKAVPCAALSSLIGWLSLFVAASARGRDERAAFADQRPQSWSAAVSAQ